MNKELKVKICNKKGLKKSKLNSIGSKSKIEEKGITLVVLIVTVIVLIILTGITINLTLSGDGLIDKTKKAAENYAKVETSEVEIRANLAAYMKSKMEKANSKNTPPIDSENSEGGGAEGGGGNNEPENTLTSADIIISGDKTQTSIPINLNAQVTHNADNINISSCKYKLNMSNDDLGADPSSYDNSFTSNGQIITLNPDSEGSWYLHILSADNNGNLLETIKGPIIITGNKHQHTGNSTTSGGCYTKEVISHTYCSGTLKYNGRSWDPNDGTGRYVYQFQCDKCGRTYASYSSTGCVIGNGQSSISHTAWFGPLTTKKTYELNCGKTEGVDIDSYSINF